MTRKKNSTLCPDTSTTAGPGLAPDDPHRETPQFGVGVLRAPGSDSRPASASRRTSGLGGGSRRRRHVQPQHLVYSGPANWSPPPAAPDSSPPRAPGAGLSGSTLTSCRLSGREALRADAGRRSRAGSVRCRRARWLAAPGEGGRPRQRLARQTCQQECSLRCVNAASGRADRCQCCESVQSQGGSTSRRCRCGPLRLTYRSGFPSRHSRSIRGPRCPHRVLAEKNRERKAAWRMACQPECAAWQAEFYRCVWFSTSTSRTEP
jgi:hypothetical protein